LTLAYPGVRREPFSRLAPGKKVEGVTRWRRERRRIPVRSRSAS
jgi:hypothetical protein